MKVTLKKKKRTGKRYELKKQKKILKGQYGEVDAEHVKYSKNKVI